MLVDVPPREGVRGRRTGRQLPRLVGAWAGGRDARMGENLRRARPTWTRRAAANGATDVDREPEGGTGTGTTGSGRGGGAFSIYRGRMDSLVGAEWAQGTERRRRGPWGAVSHLELGSIIQS